MPAGSRVALALGIACAGRASNLSTRDYTRANWPLLRQTWSSELGLEVQAVNWNSGEGKSFFVRGDFTEEEFNLSSDVRT